MSLARTCGMVTDKMTTAKAHMTCETWIDTAKRGIVQFQRANMEAFERRGVGEA